MTEHVIAETSDFEEADRILVSLKGKEIGLFEIDGEYHALLNWCVHQGGPCCEGPITGTKRGKFDRETLKTDIQWVRDGEILSCPWHGWEYDATSGECLSDSRFALPKYPVRVDDDGRILVDLG